MRRFVAVNYCDDIREEVGNKLSLVGIYGPDLVVSSFPATLPKFCLFVQVFNNAGEVFEGNMTFKLSFDDNILLEHKVEGETPLSGNLASDEFEKRIFQVVFAPFSIERAGTLRTRVYFDEEEHRGPALRIRTPSS